MEQILFDLYLVASVMLLLTALPGVGRWLAPSWALVPAAKQGEHPLEYALNEGWLKALDRSSRVFFATGRMGRAPVPKMKPVENEVTVAVVKPLFTTAKEMGLDGGVRERLEFTGKTVFVRKYRITNTVLPIYYGELVKKYEFPVLVVEWPDGVEARHLGQKFTVSFPGRDNAEKLERIVYDGSWFAGANAKSRKTFAFPVGYKPFYQEFMKTAEASVKMSRAVVPNGRVAMMGDMKVLVVKDGTVPFGNPIEDGFLYLADDLVMPHIQGLDQIMLGDAKQNGQIWQNLPWNDIKDDAASILDAHWSELAKSSSIQITRRALGARGADIRNRLVEANPVYLKHPFNANDVSKLVRRWFIEMSTSLPLPLTGFVAVPTLANEYILPKGEWGVVRWPVASYDGVSYVKVTKENKSEMERIRSMKCACQVTFTCKEGSLKGLAGVVKRSKMGGFDMITSESNFKIGQLKQSMSLSKKQTSLETVLSGVLVILNIYDASCLAGVPNHSTFVVNGQIVYGNQNDVYGNGTNVHVFDRILLVGWKDKAGDYDGDMLFVMLLNGLKKIIKALKNMPHVPTLKNVKTAEALSRTQEFLINVFYSPLGWLTNLRGKTLATTPERRVQIPVLLQEAGIFKQASVKKMDYWLSAIIQAAVDVFKSMGKKCWSPSLKGVAGQLHKQLKIFFGGPASWQGWMDNPVAFTTVLPDFYGNLSQDYVDDLEARMKSGVVKIAEQAQAEWDCHIPDGFEGGTIPEIYRYVRDYLKIVWKQVDPDPLELTYFYGHAPASTRADEDAALRFRNTVWGPFHDDVVSPAINGEEDYGDTVEEVMTWETMWRDRCAEWVLDEWNGDERRAAAALWHACHTGNTTKAEAAAVMYGFPDYCVEFAKRGLAPVDVVKTLITGVGYHFDGVPPRTAEISVQVIHENNRTWIIAKAPLGGQKWDDGFTKPGTLGIVPRLEPGHLKKGFVAPVPGNYEASLTLSGSTYEVTLKVPER